MSKKTYNIFAFRILTEWLENMQTFPWENTLPTVILRHKKENLKKCSLRGLESRPDFRFFTYPVDALPLLPGYVLLSLDAPPLTLADADYGLFILDGTWRYVKKMLRYIASNQSFIHRSLPNSWRTAYPRRQKDCPLPEQGLASIEAVYAGCCVLRRETTALLDNYYWKRDFLNMNACLIKQKSQI